MGSSHSYLQNLDLANTDVKVMKLDDWCYMNDSAKAMKICSAEQMHPTVMPMTMPTVVATHMPIMPAVTTMPMTMPMTAAASPMMELSRIGNFFHKAETDITTEFHKVDWKDLGIDAWHGITWCYSDAACNAAVKKYGAKAVETAAEDSLLMNLENRALKFFQGKDDGKIDHAFSRVGQEIKNLGIGAWHGVEHCYATPKCKAAVEKYGLDAVKIALVVALAPAGALQNLCDGGDCNQMHFLQL